MSTWRHKLPTRRHFLLSQIGISVHPLAAHLSQSFTNLNDLFLFYYATHIPYLLFFPISRSADFRTVPDFLNLRLRGVLHLLVVEFEGDVFEKSVVSFSFFREEISVKEKSTEMNLFVCLFVPVLLLNVLRWDNVNPFVCNIKSRVFFFIKSSLSVIIFLDVTEARESKLLGKVIAMQVRARFSNLISS
ncbi:hypothetical protein Csa_000789 [Cucumis sativus]|uniref:Uncharacterized protein n=1 Tax=Cucumis sativus TaxID=3659 RepID=A0A0A0LD94_CUCSA|nr:hypothetical protein Csa_000789 [Cucumis sativus]